jgi:hypothetical protein
MRTMRPVIGNFSDVKPAMKSSGFDDSELTELSLGLLLRNHVAAARAIDKQHPADARQMCIPGSFERIDEISPI